jgi:membrane fusion protein, heavy metal efflux system
MKRILIVLAVLSAACETRTRAKSPDPPETAKAQPPAEISFSTDSPKLAKIRVEAVDAEDVPTAQVSTPGKVEANPNRLSHVVLPVAGRVAAVRVRLGDFVKQGDVVLTLESSDVDQATSTYLQAEASVTQARAALAKAQADLDRMRDLFEHNAVAKKELLNAEAVLAQSKAAVEQAQASSEQARRRLEILGVKPGQFGQRLEIRAPISGKVLEMSVAPGEFRNDTAASLMTIADLSSVWVTSDVPESSIRMVQLGERVDIELTAYPGTRFSGRVKQIADTVDPQTRTVKVRAELDNREGSLRPEMFAQIRFTNDVVKKPVVPVGAVLQGDGQNVIWRQESPGVFRQIPVTLGSRVGDRVAVLTGLRRGDRIVTDGVMLLRNN